MTTTVVFSSIYVLARMDCEYDQHSIPKFSHLKDG